LADNKFILKFSGDTTQLQGAVAQANNTLTGFANKVRSLGGMMAAGFAVSQIGEFVLDVSKLAGEAEGVRVAFERLPASTQLMLDLKEATSGTVSELDLMKRSVMAANFGISLKALPELLEFASIRAKQTGQSVDYLVDSIVTGIGRKSKLILDNLGISAVALGEAMHGVSMEAATVGEVAEAVGKIASENLKQMGEMSENASTKIERLSANWTNLKVAIGDSANSTGILGTAIDALSGYMVVLASDNLSATEKIAAFNGAMGLSVSLSKDAALTTAKAASEQKKANEIHETALVLYRDLGLNYEALMNVAGDNVDVMEIWAEMQKIADERAKVLNDSLKTQAERFKGIETKLPEITYSLNELNAVWAALQARTELPIIDIGDIDPEIIDQKTEMVFAKIRARTEEFKQTILEANAIVEQGIENTISGFSSALGDMASGAGGAELLGAALLSGIGAMSIQLGQLAIGAGIAVMGIKKALQSLNPAIAIAGGIALIALGKLVSNKAAQIGRSGGGGGGGGGFSGGGSSFGGGSYGSRMESVGQRIELTFTGDAGKVLKASLIKQDRIDSRTRS
jgi:hypothetical protein